MLECVMGTYHTFAIYFNSDNTDAEFAFWLEYSCIGMASTRNEPIEIQSKFQICSVVLIALLPQVLITYTILVVPYYNYGIMGPKTLFKFLSPQTLNALLPWRPFLVLAATTRKGCLVASRANSGAALNFRGRNRRQAVETRSWSRGPFPPSKPPK